MVHFLAVVFKVILKDTIFKLIPLPKFWGFCVFSLSHFPILAAHGE